MRKLLGLLCVCALAIVTARAQDAVDDGFLGIGFSQRFAAGEPFLSGDRKSTRLNSSHTDSSRMPSSA